jgi:hypothetical protein
MRRREDVRIIIAATGSSFVSIVYFASSKEKKRGKKKT